MLDPALQPSVSRHKFLPNTPHFVHDHILFAHELVPAILPGKKQGKVGRSFQISAGRTVLTVGDSTILDELCAKAEQLRKEAEQDRRYQGESDEPGKKSDESYLDEKKDRPRFATLKKKLERFQTLDD